MDLEEKKFMCFFTISLVSLAFIIGCSISSPLSVIKISEYFHHIITSFVIVVNVLLIIYSLYMLFHGKNCKKVI